MNKYQRQRMMQNPAARAAFMSSWNRTGGNRAGVGGAQAGVAGAQPGVQTGQAGVQAPQPGV